MFQSEVHHENGSFIPVSYFVNGPIEGMDIYQVWIAMASPASCNKSLAESTRASEVSTVRRHENEESNLVENDMCSGEYLLHYQVMCQLCRITMYPANATIASSVCQADR